jgi:two-component system, OmpR family, response regulator
VRILIVEDERLLALSLQRGLQGEGHSVEVASDGQTGLWFATEEEFDAIILDLMLPELNGYRVLEQLRARERWTPVLVLTAKAGEHDQTDALDGGADDFLSKPFTYSVLSARLRALVRRGQPPRPTILSAGDLTVDPALRTCHVGDAEVALTNREFHLLEYLVRSAPNVVTKYELLDRVWGGGFDADTKVVDVYIGYLRAKVDRPFNRSCIQTVRGAGYRYNTRS